MTPDRYHIGAVARLADVPVETLRTWERRYGLPTPMGRDGTARVFDAAEVERVRLVAELHRLGERVRDLAPLDRGVLEGRLAARQARRPLPAAIRVAAVLPPAFEDLDGPGPSGAARVSVVARAPTAAALPPLDPGVDVLVVAAPDPGRDLVAEVDAAVDAARPGGVVVVAAFLDARTRRALASRGVRRVGDPRPDELRRAIEDVARSQRDAPPERGEAPPPALRPEELRRFMTTPSRVACECLNHLASLAYSLEAFERYSAACVTAGGDDVELHRGLARDTGHARAIVEGMLLRVARHEGLTP